ncbi:unnamed protein product, partial [Iphiclides podalirius]
MPLFIAKVAYAVVNGASDVQMNPIARDYAALAPKQRLSAAHRIPGTNRSTRSAKKSRARPSKQHWAVKRSLLTAIGLERGQATGGF